MLVPKGQGGPTYLTTLWMHHLIEWYTMSCIVHSATHSVYYLLHHLTSVVLLHVSSDKVVWPCVLSMSLFWYISWWVWIDPARLEGNVKAGCTHYLLPRPAKGKKRE